LEFDDRDIPGGCPKVVAGRAGDRAPVVFYNLAPKLKGTFSPFFGR
jgi:hypothetical protein